MMANLTIPLPKKEYSQYKGDSPKSFVTLPESEEIEIGDTIELVEIDSANEPTGEKLNFEITYIIADPLKKGQNSVGIKTAE